MRRCYVYLLLVLLLPYTFISQTVLATVYSKNWLVVLSTSRFWLNYRHTSSALYVYNLARKINVPKSNIILLLPENAACNNRNLHQGSVFGDGSYSTNLYSDEVKVDYKDTEVTISTFTELLTASHEPFVSRNKRLLSDERSNVFLYITGHGGEGFLKFQDVEEITSKAFGKLLSFMSIRKRYNKLLTILDTCQAESMFDYAPKRNFIGVYSSKIGESSWSHRYDPVVGISLADRFSSILVETILSRFSDLHKPISEFVSLLSYADLLSHQGTISTLPNTTNPPPSFLDFLLPTFSHSPVSVFISSLPVTLSTCYAPVQPPNNHVPIQRPSYDSPTLSKHKSYLLLPPLQPPIKQSFLVYTQSLLLLGFLSILFVYS